MNPLYYRSDKAANAFLIQFNSAVPQQVLALPAEQERRYLNSEQEVWLMQLVAKDFLNLSNFGGGGLGSSISGYGGGGGGGGGHSTVDGSSFHTNPISEISNARTTANSNAGSNRPSGGGYAGGGYKDSSTATSNNADQQQMNGGSDGENHWLKVLAIEQLNVTATTLYFTFSQEDDDGGVMKHSFAVVITTPHTLGHKIAVRAIWDRLVHMHARVMSIFFNRDGDDFSTPAAAAAAGGGTAAGGGSSSQYRQEPPMGIVGTLGHDSDRRNNYYPHLETTASARADEDDFGADGNNKNLKATTIATTSDAHNANMSASDAHQYDSLDETAGYNEIWGRELEAAIADITVWVGASISRSSIPLHSTLINDLRYCASFQSNSRSSRMLDWFEQILSLALSEHRFIITGDNPRAIESLLSTLALILPDDRLLMASTQCFNGYIVPELTFQGTTLPISKIKTRLVWFRYPVAIVDITKQAPLDRPVHYLPTRDGGKKIYAVFKEWRKTQIERRRNLTMSNFMQTSLNPTRVISPIVQVISKRFLNFIGFPTVGLVPIASKNSGGGVALSGTNISSGNAQSSREKNDQLLNANLLRGSAAGSVLGSGIATAVQSGGPYASGSLHSPSVGPSQSTTDPVAATATPSGTLVGIGASSFAIQTQQQQSSMHNNAQAAASYSLNSTSNQHNQPQMLQSTASTAHGMSAASSLAFLPNQAYPPHGPFRHPLLGEEKGLVMEGPAALFPQQFYDSLMFILQQWRRTLEFRSLAFFESEIKMGRGEERDRPAPLRLSDGDLHVLLASVETIYPVGVSLEERAQAELMANFDF